MLCYLLLEDMSLLVLNELKNVVQEEVSKAGSAGDEVRGGLANCYSDS